MSVQIFKPRIAVLEEKLVAHRGKTSELENELKESSKALEESEQRTKALEDDNAEGESCRAILQTRLEDKNKLLDLVALPGDRVPPSFGLILGSLKNADIKQIFTRQGSWGFRPEADPITLGIDRRFVFLFLDHEESFH